MPRVAVLSLTLRSTRDDPTRLSATHGGRFHGGRASDVPGPCGGRRGRPRSPHEVVARGPLRHVHPLGPLQHPGPPRVGHGRGRHPRRGVRATGQTLQAQAQRRARLGAPGQTGRPEVHGDDHQAPRRLLPVRYQAHRLLRAQAGPGRDLVKEYVEAARAEGMRVGFYYSLMDWHHPDGARCATDEAARRRFVDYIHGQIRELLTNYGKIDVLWYDVDWPLTPTAGSRKR